MRFWLDVLTELGLPPELGAPGSLDGRDLFAILGEPDGLDTLAALRCADIVALLVDDWVRCDLLLLLFACSRL